MPTVSKKCGKNLVFICQDVIHVIYFTASPSKETKIPFKNGSKGPESLRENVKVVAGTDFNQQTSQEILYQVGWGQRLKLVWSQEGEVTVKPNSPFCCSNFKPLIRLLVPPAELQRSHISVCFSTTEVKPYSLWVKHSNMQNCDEKIKSDKNWLVTSEEADSVC